MGQEWNRRSAAVQSWMGHVPKTWRALRVPHDPSVKPGAAFCCHCLFAWSPSGTLTSPGPRRRLFKNDGSVAACRSVTLCAQKTTKHVGRTIHRQPHVFPAVNLTTINRYQKLVHTGWHKVRHKVGTRLRLTRWPTPHFGLLGLFPLCCRWM